MMNVTINRDDYANYEDFIENLKKALSYKGGLFAKQAVNTLDVRNMYTTLLPDYLYYKLFYDIEEPYEGDYTHYIIVEQVGGSGGYFFKDGLHRKYDNTVHFKIYPPIDMFISNILMNNNPISKLNNNESFFTMPNSDAHVQIIYSNMINSSIIYYGVSPNNSPDNVDITSNFNVNVNIDNNSYTIPFNNTNNIGYIWFATELDVNLQKVSMFEPFNITGSFDENETNTTIPEGYKFYFHKWPTAITTLTLSKE